MKQNYLSLILIAIAFIFGFSSCQDDEKNEILLEGKWNYTKPHVVLDYELDTITIPTNKEPIKISVEDAKILFTTMAHEKMGSYFNGIEFLDNKKLLLGMNMSGNIVSKEVEYILKDENLNVSLVGIVPDNIPINQINLKYKLDADNMLVFLDSNYIILLANSMQVMLVNMFVDMGTTQIPGFEQMAPAQQTIIKDQLSKKFTETFNDILSKIEKVEIGFNLQKI